MAWFDHLASHSRNEDYLQEFDVAKQVLSPTSLLLHLILLWIIEN